MKLLAPFVCGVVFALGLGISGMTNADTVLAFLNLAGTWDPTLAFVMVGAIGAHRLLYGPILRRGSPCSSRPSTSRPPPDSTARSS